MVSHDWEEVPLQGGDEGGSLYRTLRVTTHLDWLPVVGMALVLADMLLLAAGAHWESYPVLVKTGLTICAFGLVAISFNMACDVAAAVTVEGWMRAAIVVFNGQLLIPGRYALKHAGNIASLFSRKPYLLWLILAYVAALAAGALWFTFTLWTACRF